MLHSPPRALPRPQKRHAAAAAGGGDGGGCGSGGGTSKLWPSELRPFGFVAQASVDVAAIALRLQAEARTAEMGEELKQLRRESGGASQLQGHVARREANKGTVWEDGTGIPKTITGWTQQKRRYRALRRVLFGQCLPAVGCAKRVDGEGRPLASLTKGKELLRMLQRSRWQTTVPRRALEARWSVGGGRLRVALLPLQSMRPVLSAAAVRCLVVAARRWRPSRRSTP